MKFAGLSKLDFAGILSSCAILVVFGSCVYAAALRSGGSWTVPALCIVLGAFMAALCVLLFWKVATRQMMRPLKEVALTAQRITHEDLGARIVSKAPTAEIQDLVDEFNGMVSRLESSFAYIVQSNAFMAHELKTPLAIIRGEAEIALKKERDGDEYRRVIRVGLEETIRMLKTIDDLLCLTKMNYRPESLEHEQFDLAQLLREIYEQNVILAGKNTVSLRLDVPPEPLMVNGDMLSLRRLFFNLIDNAVKFTPPAGKVGIAASRIEGAVAVSISDTGIGIAEENLPKLFDKFYRVSGDKQGTVSGSGLGLCIAQSIARLHGGAITVASKLHHGSTFTVSIPLATVLR